MAAPEHSPDLNLDAIVVISFSKRLAPSPDPGSSELCASWELTSQDIKYFFASANKETPEGIHARYAELACMYVGYLEIDGKRYEFKVNGGNYGVIFDSSAGLTKYFGCRIVCQSMFPFMDYSLYDREIISHSLRE